MAGKLRIEELKNSEFNRVGVVKKRVYLCDMLELIAQAVPVGTKVGVRMAEVALVD